MRNSVWGMAANVRARTVCASAYLKLANCVYINIFLITEFSIYFDINLQNLQNRNALAIAKPSFGSSFETALPSYTRRYNLNHSQKSWISFNQSLSYDTTFI